mmetsp:Transcript_12636/g.35524  ORF Transcript_12636/g.35524 Transcript_12636/m.35524 type:complete len:174 (-) Transcript_12636:302-823(-)
MSAFHPAELLSHSRMRICLLSQPLSQTQAQTHAGVGHQLLPDDHRHFPSLLPTFPSRPRLRRLVVLLDDSSARQRCLVDHGLIQRWTGGLTPAQLSMAAEPRRTDLLAPLRALLQKAEGMWHIEFPGGCDSGCLPVIMDMTPGIDNRTTASLLDRCRQLRLWAPAAFPPSNNG